MNWAIYCRFNQARSIIGAAVLRHHYPEITIRSGGIEAQKGGAIPQSVIMIARAWGLDKYDRASSVVDSNWIKQAEPKIVVADSYVLERLDFDSNLTKINQLSDFEDHPFLIPIDPTGMSLEDLALELSKVVVLTLRWASKNLMPSLDITAHLLVSNQYNYPELTHELLLEEDILIDTNIVRASQRPWYKNRHIVYFNPRNLGDINREELIHYKNSILVSRFEIDDCEKFFLSQAWREFLYSLAQECKIALISESIETNRLPLSSSILATAHSTQTQLWNRFQI